MRWCCLGNRLDRFSEFTIINHHPMSFAFNGSCFSETSEINCVFLLHFLHHTSSFPSSLEWIFIIMHLSCHNCNKSLEKKCQSNNISRYSPLEIWFIRANFGLNSLKESERVTKDCSITKCCFHDILIKTNVLSHDDEHFIWSNSHHWNKNYPYVNIMEYERIFQ